MTPCRRLHFTIKNNHGENKEAIVSPQDVKLVLDAAAVMDDDGLGTDIPGAKTGKGKKLAIVFTCTVCETRSAKQFTEQAYRNGVVLVRCPGCENLHLIADRLGYFEDKGNGGWDIEKAMAKMGENVTAVTNDNVLELTLQDVVGKTKMEQALAKAGGDKGSGDATP
jgi:protein import protein ZIM17